MVKMLNPEDKILNTTIGEFWSWAYSDILLNVNRGVFAEFLVAKKLGVDVRNYHRIVYDYADIHYEGKTIQVKSSAYVQSWHLSDFNWDNISDIDNGCDNKKLYEFLKQYYHIDWEKKARITKNDNDNEIKLWLGKDSISLRRIAHEKKFTLTYKGKTDTFKYKNWKLSKIQFNIEPKRLDDSCKMIPDKLIPDPNGQGENFAPDCYVLCIYEEDKVTEANVLDITKWKFYVIKTLDKNYIYMSDPKSLNLVEYDKLKEKIDSVLGLKNRCTI